MENYKEAKVKGFKINDPLLIATLLCFGEVLPEAELKVLGVLIKYSRCLYTSTHTTQDAEVDIKEE